jgi:hypothetical protein
MIQATGAALHAFAAASLRERETVEGAPADSQLTMKEIPNLCRAEFRKMAQADPQDLELPAARDVFTRYGFVVRP